MQNTDTIDPDPLLALGYTNELIRLLVCHRCQTTETVSWCGGSFNCKHPECTDALEHCVTPHRIPGNPRRLHGAVSLVYAQEHLRERLSHVKMGSTLQLVA